MQDAVYLLTKASSIGEIFLLTRRNVYLILMSMTPDSLKAWRAKHGYTQVKLAQALDVDEMTVSRWERGVYLIPGFLALALWALERKGGEKKVRGQ